GNKVKQGDQAWRNQISCCSVGNCGIVGYMSIADGLGNIYTQPFVVNQIDGKWGQAIRVPGIKTAAPNDGQDTGATAISCTAPARCSIGGDGQADAHTHATPEKRPYPRRRGPPART